MTDPIAAHLAAVRRDRYSDATLTARARILATLPDPLGMDRLATLAWWESRQTRPDGEPRAATVTLDGGRATVVIDGLGRSFAFASGSGELWLQADGDAVHVRTHRAVHGRDRAADASPTLTSPLPGTVVAVAVDEGAHVEVGEPILAVEAMKMEHVLRATVAGTVRLQVAAGDQVARGSIVATIEREDA